MLTPTHLVTAQTAFLIGCITTGHAPSMIESVTALAASLLPDLDSRQSYVGRVFRPVSSWLEDVFGHRTMTHSLIAQTVAGGVAYLTLPFGYYLAIVAGWVSHTVADMMTPSGVAWFWPYRVRCVLPGNSRYRMACMSTGELWFLVIVGLIGVVLMPLAETGKSTTGLIRSVLGAMESARKEYDANKGERAYWLTVTGRDNRSYRNISGRYYVIGPWSSAGFLIDVDGSARTVCQAPDCDWYADHASIEAGAREITATRRLDARSIHADTLSDALAPIIGTGRTYLIGSAKTGKIDPIPPVMTRSGDTIRFQYATPADLDTIGSAVLHDLSMTVQWRTGDGREVPDIELRETPTSDTDLLRRWLGNVRKDQDSEKSTAQSLHDP